MVGDRYKGLIMQFLMEAGASTDRNRIYVGDRSFAWKIQTLAAIEVRFEFK